MINFEELYNNLMALQSNEAFYYSDQVKEDKLYRIFLYRLATYSDFQLPSALESRGIMFEIDRAGKPLRLASMPFEKFFNKDENPFTMDLDFNDAQNVYLKEDGSLISTYMHGDEMFFKTKGSLHSEQAVDANAWIRLPFNATFYNELKDLTKNGYTVMMEWVAPHNRIVVGYDAPNLVVLGVRSMHNGNYLGRNDVATFYSEVAARWVKDYLTDIEDVSSYINDIPSMVGIEGFVVVLATGQRVKIKTDWYLHRHRVKDSISNAKHLVEAILNEATDDIKSLFAHDRNTIDYILDMERKVIPQYNRLVKDVEQFWANNKHLDRKDYAILSKETNADRMGLYMSMYLGREVKYKDFFMKHMNRFINVSEKELVDAE